jgi:hypothetical protein
MLQLIELGSSLPDIVRLLGCTEEALAEEAAFLSVMLPQHGAIAVSTITSDSSANTATVHYAPLSKHSRNKTP